MLRKIVYALLLIGCAAIALAAANPEVKNITASYTITVVRTDTTTGSYVAGAMFSSFGDSLKLATFDVTRWDKLWLRIKTTETIESGNLRYASFDSAGLYGIELTMVVNAEAAVSPTTGKPIVALEDSPADTAWTTFDFTKFYLNCSDTTKFIPEVQLWIRPVGDTVYFANPVDSLTFSGSGDAADTLAVFHYDFEITTIKK